MRAHGITLSKNQHAHVNRLIAERGPAGRVTMELRDYRDLPEDEPYDKIASVGMFEHVGHVMLPAYFAKIWRLRRARRPAAEPRHHRRRTRNEQLGAGMGDFIERYIFPAANCCTCRTCWRCSARRGLEALDVENLRPHYARARCGAGAMAWRRTSGHAREVTGESVVRAYRLYLAGSARCASSTAGSRCYQMLASSGPAAASRATRCAVHNHPTRSNAPTCTVEPMPCSTSSSPRQPETSSCSPRPATRCCASPARASPRPAGILRSRRHARRALALEAAGAGEASRLARRRGRGRRVAGLPPRESVTLRQRVWPLAEMIRRAHAAKADTVWGRDGPRSAFGAPPWTGNSPCGVPPASATSGPAKPDPRQPLDRQTPGPQRTPPWARYRPTAPATRPAFSSSATARRRGTRSRGSRATPTSRSTRRACARRRRSVALCRRRHRGDLCERPGAAGCRRRRRSRSGPAWLSRRAGLAASARFRHLL